LEHEPWSAHGKPFDESEMALIFASTQSLAQKLLDSRQRR
jgi:hypothetical protein